MKLFDEEKRLFKEVYGSKESYKQLKKTYTDITA